MNEIELVDDQKEYSKVIKKATKTTAIATVFMAIAVGVQCVIATFTFLCPPKGSVQNKKTITTPTQSIEPNKPKETNMQENKDTLDKILLSQPQDTLRTQRQLNQK